MRCCPRASTNGRSIATQWCRPYSPQGERSDCRLLRLDDRAGEQVGACLVVADRAEEGTVDVHEERALGRADAGALDHADRSDGSRLGALFVDLDEGLVLGLADGEVAAEARL